VWRETPDNRELVATPADLRVGKLAARQGGVVSVAQLHAAGLGRTAIHTRVRGGRLVRLHRGVYAVGHSQLTALGWRWAAVLACGGPGLAALSHRSAAAVWDLLPSPAQFDVSTLASARSTAKIRVHRGLQPQDITTIDRLPLTTVARTLVDLTATLTPHQIERLVHRAEHLRLLDMHSLNAQLARAQGRPTSALRAALRTLETGDPDITRTLLEERFLQLVVDAQLPRPEVNAMVGEHEVDFLWRAERLIVETDGAATHLTPTAFEDDRRRDAHLSLLGFRTLRFTWRQVIYEPAFVADVLRGSLTPRWTPK
jgi:very-short-patch-repair endonuclease